MNLKTILQIFLIQAIVLMGAAQTGNKPVEIWISPAGDDSNPGTLEAPMASLSMALRKAREMRRLNDTLVTEGVHIILKGGLYRQYEPLLIRPEDSGSKLAPTIIQAAPGETPVLSGGIMIDNWKKAESKIDGLPDTAQGNVWIADIPIIWGDPLNFRQLWVNNKKTLRASSFDDGEPDRILSVNNEKEEIWIPKPKIPLKEPQQLEFIIHQWWAIANLRVKTLDINGDKTRLTFHNPESRIEFEHPWPAPFIDKNHEYNGNSAFFFANAIELLNQPGEWFRDPLSGKIYYWPLDDEDMTTSRIIVPVLETIVQIVGTLDNPVQYLVFRGLAFEHTTWIRPSEEGHVPLQAGMFLIDAYKLGIPGTKDKSSLENQAWIGRQPAGVTVNGAANIEFDRCTFTHMAATGLDFLSGTNTSFVEGCLFRDIGGTAIQLGFFGNNGIEAHVPYQPSDLREVCHHVRIANNFITDCTNEDWGCVGVSIGYAHDINIEYNEISYLNYSGICVGWGWTKTTSCLNNNRVHANHIHHFARQMYDVGGIYTLSAQPNTEISNNSIHHLEKAPFAHIPDHYQYIYLDEGSSYIRVINNWTERDKFFSNSPGPGNEWINNGPGVSDQIRTSAGLQPEFRDLLEK